MRRSQLAAICGIVILTSWPSAHVLRSGVVSYTLEDLGTLNGAPLMPRSINSSGHVVGNATTADGAGVAFILDGQQARRIGSQVGEFIEAHAINDKDEVVGLSMGSDGFPFAVAYTTAGGIRALALPQGYWSSAFGINASGQVTGYAGSSALHAFRYSDADNVVYLGTFGGSESYGYGINDAGQVTGCSQTVDNKMHAFLSDDATSMVDLGTLGGSQSCGVSINRHGQAAGWSWLFVEPTQHAFRYSKEAGLEDLGTLGGADSFATAINDDGTVVGWSLDGNGERHAFVFTDAEGLIDLNSLIDPALGWVLTEANGINAGGQIVGVGLVGIEPRAFRLTPPPSGRPAPTDTIPPNIASVTAQPPALWPPHGEMVAVSIRAVATDAVDPAPACRITGVTSSEAETGTSNQDRPRDFVVTGDLSLRVRAELGHKSRERLYTIAVTCTDASGNEAGSQVSVRVVKNPWEVRRY
jgi:probable HAF family extracellular repeat protein